MPGIPRLVFQDKYFQRLSWLGTGLNGLHDAREYANIIPVYYAGPTDSARRNRICEEKINENK